MVSLEPYNSMVKSVTISSPDYDQTEIIFYFAHAGGRDTRFLDKSDTI